jgi:ribonuclease Z
MRFELTPLGTGAALPARGRSPSAQILNVNEHLYLIDCGEGTQERIREAGFNFQRIEHVFISHLHGDHYLGFLGLISTMHLLGREGELHVYAPPELREIVSVQLRASRTYLRFPLQHHDLPDESGAVIMSDAQVKVIALRLEHRIPTMGFLFREQPRLRTLRPDRVREIPVRMRQRVKEGEDLLLEDGTRISCEELTIAPPAPRSYAYCSDTARVPGLIPFLRGVDLLYHEATFTEALKARAKETLHSTARDAAKVALECGAKRLLLGHFSSRYKDLEILLAEARAVFPDCGLAQEGSAVVIGPQTAVENS